MTKDILLEKAKEIYGDKYDYSLVPDNFRAKEKLCIIYSTSHDNMKRKLCEENNITLLYYSNIKFDFPYEVITVKEVLLTLIRK